MYEALQILYTYIPRDLLIIIMGGLFVGVMLQYEEYKNGKTKE